MNVAQSSTAKLGKFMISKISNTKYSMSFYDAPHDFALCVTDFLNGENKKKAKRKLIEDKDCGTVLNFCSFFVCVFPLFCIPKFSGFQAIIHGK